MKKQKKLKPPKQMSVKEYADLIGITPQGVHKQISDNKLKKGVSADRIGRYYIITINS